MSDKVALQAGIHSLSMDVYLNDPCSKPSLSSSIIHSLCSESPRHAWTAHPKLNPQVAPEEAEHFDIGKAAHSILLEGVDVAEVLDYPDWRTRDARAARNIAREAGKVPLLAKHHQSVMEMVSAARFQLDQHRDGKKAFKDGNPEQTLIWEEGGMWCRARLDWLMNDHSAIWDYKTTGASANPEIVSRTLFQNGYDIQAAWYLRGLRTVAPWPDKFSGKERQFRFTYQETYPPYALSVVALGPDAIMLAEKKIIYAMDLWRKCLESGDWPGYPDQTCFANLPAYEEERWLKKETADAV